MKVSIVQMNSGDDITQNLALAQRLIGDCVRSERPDFVALPEYFSFISGVPAEMRAGAGRLAELDIPGFLAGLAREYSITLHGGTSLVLENGQLFNQSYVYDASGSLLCTYRKIHLFDTVMPNGVRMFESDIISRGNCLAAFNSGGFSFGCSICFDVRFPELYARLVEKGAQCLLVPSAFTFATGADHWEILLRARAIETQCYVLAPAQVFSFSDGKYVNWGHSMIIDPWGAVVAQISAQEGFASANLSASVIDNVRNRLPVQTNRFWKPSDE